jgi:hypothetical protein
MREVSKEEFREAYFRYGRGRDGWTQDYWIRFHEQVPDRGMKYRIEDPTSADQTRMMIVTDHAAGEYRLFLMAEEAEERFFGP